MVWYRYPGFVINVETQIHVRNPVNVITHHGYYPIKHPSMSWLDIWTDFRFSRADAKFCYLVPIAKGPKRPFPDLGGLDGPK